MKETTAWTLQTMIAAAALIGVLHMARGCEADRQSTLARAAEQCIASGGTWISPDLEEAQDLARDGLGGTCRITNCDPREYRRYARAEAIERGRVAA